MESHKEQVTMFDEMEDHQDGPVTCLGMTFNNDEERRAYFTEQLRKKLPELKKMEGFPIGEDEDILALSDPPYYTACPNPWINDLIDEWKNEKQQQYAEHENDYHRELFAFDVSEGKNDPMYLAHSYHTKVPYRAIIRYILHYTNPGDIIYDGFSGTGMTGVAANYCASKSIIEDLGYRVSGEEIFNDSGHTFSKVGARKAILQDLSPIAAHIAKNLTTERQDDFEQFVNSQIDEIEKKYSWLYETQHTKSDTIGRINYVVWSEVFICPNCASEISFWDVAVDIKNNEIKENFNCNHCNVELSKRNLERVLEHKFSSKIEKTYRQNKYIPTLINYSVGGKRFDKVPDQRDLDLLKKIEELDVNVFYPTNKIIQGDEIGRLSNLGFDYSFQLMSVRNNIIIGSLYEKFIKSKYKNPGIFLLTASLPNLTWMYRWRINKKGGSTSGTYYICSTPQENNPFNQIRRKLTDIMNVISINSGMNNTAISTMSSTNNSIHDNSIDYIFTDPPFGSNLMYSELNFLWESWIKVATRNEPEAIINSNQNKTNNEYKELMVKCFKENYRILKPGRWMTVVFSNSKAIVWNSIQEALQRAGFIVANVAVLDKKQGSFKAVTTATAVKQDLVISAYKPREENINKMFKEQNTEESAWTFVNQHLEQLPVFIGEKGEAQMIVERTPRILFDRMIAYHVQKGLPVPISSAEFQEGITQRYPMRDGMAFLESQVAEYDKKRILVKEFSQMSLFVSDENSAIEWIRQQLMTKPQTRQDLHPNYTKEIQHIAKHELLPELDQLLEQNFLMYEGNESVPSQIHTYLSSNYKDLRGLDKNDPRLKEKAKNRWYIPDPNKQADLEKLREKSLLREFANYKEEIEKSKKKLKQFRTEAIRAGFKKAWGEKDFATIVNIGERLPESVIQEDDKLLMYFDNAQIRLGM
ncbi:MULTISPECIES: DNA methyltransferase [Brevibacillus]|uniref:DNA methyltransferase n=1 Tax=Brevibacillus TaxID=55080 RepID=UPI001C2BA1C3|nr:MULTISPECIES: DNA methyltransferase [Brevibacillus]UED70183.1 site-specific DNA-methyltransferase [Brevibacillus sp. HD3.3A]WDV96481.1 DNA methyltransferase [Brevibacillus parabrevis]